MVRGGKKENKQIAPQKLFFPKFQLRKSLMDKRLSLLIFSINCYSLINPKDIGVTLFFIFIYFIVDYLSSYLILKIIYFLKNSKCMNTSFFPIKNEFYRA